MRWQKITAAVLVAILLTGCFQQTAIPEVTQSPTSVPTVSTEPVATTVPAETTLPPETQPEESQPEEPQPEAQRLREGLNLSLAGKNRTDTLGDDNIYSKITVSPGEVLTVTCGDPFSSLYLVWDTVPESYILRWDGGSLTCGQNGFLHDYVTLPQPVTSLEITVSGTEKQSLCDLSVYTEGSVPANVQLWQPPCEEADILVFPTHADDDAIFFGALIAYYAIERQLTVQTAFMVDHTWQPHRAHERLNGLWAMGIRHYPILGSAPDTATFDFQEAMSLYYSSDILGWQVEQIRRFRPLVVVGHDLKGEYGNGGHKVNAHYLTQAITAAADPEQYPDSCSAYGTWQAAKLYLHLYRENEIYLDVNTPMVNDPLGRTPFEAAEDGFAAHISQQEWATVQQNDANRAYDCRPFGLYFTLVGIDTRADIMEHVTRESWHGRNT